MAHDVIRVTQKGQATIPKKLRDEFGIANPGRVTMESTDEGILVKRVPTPSELEGEMQGMVNGEGQSGVELLRESRKADASAEERPRNE
jgi:AbrB family looped-hinge helix DNA binding protein